MRKRGRRFGAASFSADSHEARALALIKRRCLQKECTHLSNKKQEYSSRIFIDEVHLTDTGNKILADEITKNMFN